LEKKIKVDKESFHKVTSSILILKLEGLTEKEEL
jgi:hypothetical protein